MRRQLSPVCNSSNKKQQQVLSRSPRGAIHQKAPPTADLSPHTPQRLTPNAHSPVSSLGVGNKALPVHPNTEPPLKSPLTNSGASAGRCTPSQVTARPNKKCRRCLACTCCLFTRSLSFPVRVRPPLNLWLLRCSFLFVPWSASTSMHPWNVTSHLLSVAHLHLGIRRRSPADKLPPPSGRIRMTQPYPSPCDLQGAHAEVWAFSTAASAESRAVSSLTFPFSPFTRVFTTNPNPQLASTPASLSSSPLARWGTQHRSPLSPTVPSPRAARESLIPYETSSRPRLCETLRTRVGRHMALDFFRPLYPCTGDIPPLGRTLFRHPLLTSKTHDPAVAMDFSPRRRLLCRGRVSNPPHEAIVLHADHAFGRTEFTNGERQGGPSKVIPALELHPESPSNR
ncbi:uncharacterized protein EI97DRAFT_442435 [Westerdykella ornata]|uniref:Uncharacterized protein n=1 Tax=Westerdykella ornata TaxID=318751 RepID=A0A6A6JJ50_WESOR|nr:uncharacterized protein EI97DRAFT_442435 [Westerdykella ornata]KAF2276497.1 hypothetical protein EI97DRAFT_442435 [Westerdykella ornata]